MLRLMMVVQATYMFVESLAQVLLKLESETQK